MTYLDDIQIVVLLQMTPCEVLARRKLSVMAGQHLAPIVGIGYVRLVFLSKSIVASVSGSCKILFSLGILCHHSISATNVDILRLRSRSPGTLFCDTNRLIIVAPMMFSPFLLSKRSFSSWLQCTPMHSICGGAEKAAEAPLEASRQLRYFCRDRPAVYGVTQLHLQEVYRI